VNDVDPGPAQSRVIPFVLTRPQHEATIPPSFSLSLLLLVQLILGAKISKLCIIGVIPAHIDRHVKIAVESDTTVPFSGVVLWVTGLLLLQASSAMITPIFSVTQDNASIIITMRTPYVKADELVSRVWGGAVAFACKSALVCHNSHCKSIHAC